MTSWTLWNFRLLFILFSYQPSIHSWNVENLWQILNSSNFLFQLSLPAPCATSSIFLFHHFQLPPLKPTVSVAIYKPFLDLAIPSLYPPSLCSFTSTVSQASAKTIINTFISHLQANCVHHHHNTPCDYLATFEPKKKSKHNSWLANSRFHN